MELPDLPALIVGQVRHTRLVPVRHSLRYRTYQWLVDIDDLPQLPLWMRPLASFRAPDHFGGSGDTIRDDVAQFLHARDHSLYSSDRVIMLANARVFGYVFNPLSVFWVLRPDNEVKAVIFEVHNTYGGRHAYLLDLNEQGRATTDKAFYVSPFNDRSGTYEIRLRLDAERALASVGLDRGGQRILTASTYGVAKPATKRAILRVSLTHFAMTQRVTALIHWNGIKLWLRKLPVVARTQQDKEIST